MKLTKGVSRHFRVGVGIRIGVLSTLRARIRSLRTTLSTAGGPEGETEGELRLVVTRSGFRQVVERVARNLRSLHSLFRRLYS